MDPRTNIILESFLIFFDTLCVAFSIVYVVQLRRAPVQSYRGQLDVSWTKAGSGALNLLPPIFTLVLAIADVLLYGLVYMPPAYGFLMSSTMLFGWMAVFVLWTQCHISLFDDVRGFCYQESLQSGRSPSMYEGVDEGIIRAAMVFAVFIILIYFIYVVVALRQWVKAARIWKAQREAGPTPIELRRQLERGRGSNLACLIDKAIPVPSDMFTRQ
ncbi:hypothetical protein EJ04DRAFT_297967 [Polyplosphaeria fusca]|uniref:Uncharacterized protein n=1 Tax=Polyplosphaeria fusca TaxID=682080 RepID=A0A9P4QUN6_9PLEO|nr:hypothetical protein EJ04DRAFT_297967 [Polyplosphaeria fusca]